MSESQDLILYHTLVSSFSQKVVLALEYLNLKYESRFVDLAGGEQLETWYLDLNPKGEVPTLQDGEIVLTDSADIIQYLNDTYDTRRSDEKLIPNPVTPLGKSVVETNQLIESVKFFVLTFGAAFHPQHTKDSRWSSDRKAILDDLIRRIQEKITNAQSPYKESYTYKLTKTVTGKASLEDEATFLAELDNTRKVLGKVEEQLAQSKEKWMFSNRLTVADISLAVLLFRIEKLGLRHHFWADGSLPKVASYFEKIMKEPLMLKSLR